MKYVVDRIIEEIAVLENIENKEQKEVSLSNLPQNIQEGNVVIEETFYRLDRKEEEERRKRIQEKMDRVKNLKRAEKKISLY